MSHQAVCNALVARMESASTVYVRHPRVGEDPVSRLPTSSQNVSVLDIRRLVGLRRIPDAGRRELV